MPITPDNANFIEPMLLLPAEKLPEGLAIKSGGTVRLRSRNDKDFNRKYPAIARALSALTDETVVDGEVDALDSAGRPSFSALQNGATGATIFYTVFDVMVCAGRNVMCEPLVARRELLRREVLPLLSDPVREAQSFDAALADLIAAVRAQGLEGLVAKRLDSAYGPGLRSGLGEAGNMQWQTWRCRRHIGSQASCSSR